MSNRTINRPYISGNGRGDLRERAYDFMLSLWGERALILGLVIIALMAHAFNMFHYPSINRNEDEGIYMSQAWAVLREGTLSPYTYWYDHAPAGWILISSWLMLTGGPLAFGSAIDSGRVLMLVLSLGMVPLLYLLARKLGASIPMAALGVFVFSVSPLAISYQRMVLLDNIMVFWVLVSLNLLLDGWGRLSRVVLSGLIFGLAILSKITAIFLIPAVIFIAFHQRWLHQGRFAVLGWIVPMSMVVSLYFLYALFKGELLPESASTFFLFLPEWIRDRIFAGEGQVSLIETLRWQGSRPGGTIFDPDSLVRLRIRYDWLPVDPILFVGGILATIVNFFRGFRDRLAMSAALLGLFPLIYLIRGGVVFDFYIIFNIPFFALNIAVLFTALEKFLPSRTAVLVGSYTIAVTLLFFYIGSGRTSALYESKPDQPAREAMTWIKQNIHPESMMIIGDDMWTDLREPGLGGPGFKNAHSHWKVASDPEVREGIFQDNWENVDYLVVHQETVPTYEFNSNELALEALANATLLQRWGDDQVFVEIWKVNKGSIAEKTLLDASHLYMKRQFSKGGAYYNADGTVTSENQAYAMLRSVWLNYKWDFYRAWWWTENNLLKENGLMAWLWKDGEILDTNSAADADVDAALALLFAGRAWDDPDLIEQGTQMVKAIWEHEVVMVNDMPYLTAGEWAPLEEIYVLNPSYFSPYAFRIFQEVDPENRWYDLVETSYRVIFETTEKTFYSDQSAGLPPDWIGIDPESGVLQPVDLGDDRDTTVYGFEATRTYWRIALDLRYFNDGRAQSYLDMAGFIHDEIQRKGYTSAIYTEAGDIIQSNPSKVSLAASLSALLTKDPKLANEFFVEQFREGTTQYIDGTISWGDSLDIYDQEWGWFAVALYADALPNLWWEIHEYSSEEIENE
jgi:endo-1,4-beta-D-glucanase Y/4-amino-4-deoxy-L-arabinose transferase-like glycosyltransferase